MKPRYNFWLERDGEVALSVWRVRLLAAVAETGSISAAAREMDVPYRVAWQKIHEMETQLGQKLVETQTGGTKGGGAELTTLGTAYVEQFSRFAEEAQAFLETRFEETPTDFDAQVFDVVGSVQDLVEEFHGAGGVCDILAPL